MGSCRERGEHGCVVEGQTESVQESGSSRGVKIVEGEESVLW
jgi:hypothetical protein